MAYFEGNSTVSPLASVLSSVRARVSGWIGRVDDTDPLDIRGQIRRLAETSPHLLRDIGFVEDPETGAWTNGRRRVAAPGPSGGEAWRAGRV